MDENSIELIGKYQYLIYPKTKPQDTEGLWMIVRYVDENGKTLSAKGFNLPILKDVPVKLTGVWIHDAYGKTLKVEQAEILQPTTKKGLVNYLRSLRCGVGPSRAEALYRVYGEQTWDILENDPDDILRRGISGFSSKIVEQLKDALRKTHLERELRHFCAGIIEITSQKAKQVQDKLGTDAMVYIQNDVYTLCDVSGFPFRLVDRLARKKGVSPDNESRIFHAVGYVLQQAEGDGHSCLPLKLFKSRLTEEVNLTYKNSGEEPLRLTETCIGDAVKKAAKENYIKYSGGMVYEDAVYRLEESLSKDIARLLKDQGDGIEGVDEILSEYEAQEGIRLAESQKAAVENAFLHKVSIVTGGPGTGKTTIIKAILYVHQTIFGKRRSNPLFLSPTGKAARRMTEATGREAQTIHSAVNYTGEELDESEMDTEPLDANLIVVDECSMMDLYISAVLMHRIPKNAIVVFVGDPDQLPSVSYGNVLYEMIRSKKVPTTKLDVIFRQSGESPIVTNAKKIRDGEVNLVLSNSFKVYEERSINDILARACKLYAQCARAYGLDKVILLNPYRSKSALSVNVFNANLQQIMNPNATDENAACLVRDSSVTFYEGDRVMQMKNALDVKNGDVGYIQRILVRKDPDDGTETRSALIDFDGILVTVTQEEARDLDLAYCTTVHKSQGSEYETVIFVLSQMHFVMLRRNLIYTGVTRAKKNVAIITEAKGAIDFNGIPITDTAIEKAIANDETDVRYTLLGDRIHAEVS